MHLIQITPSQLHSETMAERSMVTRKLPFNLGRIQYRMQRISDLARYGLPML